MEKEFEALTRMDDLYCAICPHKKGDCNECEYNQKSNIVYQSLTELKAIKEAKPSEALKCVDILKEDGCITTLYQGKALETIRQYILKAQGLEKVLEIIFEKQVDIMWFYQCVEANKTFEDYNSGMGRELEYLTEEEFNLIKRCSEKCH